MVKANINMLSSILKYIDINYMTDDEVDSIYALDINDEKSQKEVVQRLIVPGMKSEYSVEAINRAKEVLVMGLNNINTAIKVFQQMSFPFESDIEDKRGFLQIIYQELFKRESDIH